MSVVKNTSVPESQSKKKSNLIAYHFVRQLMAADVGWISYEPSWSNIADMLTKVQAGPVRSEETVASFRRLAPRYPWSWRFNLGEPLEAGIQVSAW